MDGFFHKDLNWGNPAIYKPDGKNAIITPSRADSASRSKLLTYHSIQKIIAHFIMRYRKYDKIPKVHFKMLTRYTRNRYKRKLFISEGCEKSQPKECLCSDSRYKRKLRISETFPKSLHFAYIEWALYFVLPIIIFLFYLFEKGCLSWNYFKRLPFSLTT